VDSRGATPVPGHERTRRRGAKVLAPAVATAILIALSLLLLLPSFTACVAPCQRHSDCAPPWVCGATGACEEPPVEHADPIDAGDPRIPDLYDGALDDSDLADPPEPDAS
jgi:hypothetical protein